MPISSGEINQLRAANKGIITEVNPLEFPEGATIDEQNFILQRDGTRQRRLGIRQELGGLEQSTATASAVSAHPWKGVGEDGDQQYVVIQVGGELYIYDASVEPLQDGLLTQLSISGWNGRKISSAVINGDFVFAFGGTRVGRIVDDLTVEYFSIETRDVWGIDDTLRVDERPLTLSDAHAYNIANQGWSEVAANEMRFSDGPDRWPSNADVYSFGAGNDDLFTEEIFVTPPFGNTPSAKGSAVINPLAPAAGRKSHLQTKNFNAYVNEALYDDQTSTGARAVASYAGRVFYAGFGKPTKKVNDTYPNLTSYVFFSSTVSSGDKLTACHQEGDPADPAGGIVATDGGFINISEAGVIYSLISTGRSIVVIASAGIWEIFSVDDIFSPDNYQVNKITNVGALSQDSITLVQDTVMYWSELGIHALQEDQVEGRLTVTNAIEGTIQSLYDAIPNDSKQKAQGFFDRFDKKVRFLYDSQARDLVNDTELIFDFTIGAWYKNSIADPSTGDGLTTYVELPILLREEDEEEVYAVNDVVLSGTDPVVVPAPLFETIARSFKYLVKTASGFYFAEYRGTDFLDWAEVDAEAWLVTGYYTGGDVARRKSSTYLTTHMERTETTVDLVEDEAVVRGESSCKVQARWEWTDHAVSGKFGPSFEAYRHVRKWFPDLSGGDVPYEDGYPVVTTKNRLRGSGRSLSLRMSTSPGKDCRLIGWNIQLNVNSKV